MFNYSASLVEQLKKLYSSWSKAPYSLSVQFHNFVYEIIKSEQLGPELRLLNNLPIFLTKYN
jgi:hypothetical protein